MRIPIIIQANPNTNRISPVVFLPDGEWAFVGNYTEECEILIIYPNESIPLKINKKFPGGRSIKLEIVNSSQKSLTISAEKCLFQ
jgi:hypothetical protein